MGDNDRGAALHELAEGTLDASEIVEPERISFSFRWEEDGERGQDNTVTVTFTEEGTRTRMTFRQAYFDSVEQCDSHFGGWSECMDRLVEQFARKAA